MPAFTPPTTSYPWPTGERLTSRLKVNRGLTVITDGNGGWTTTQFPWMGTLDGLVEGADYFLGGHLYFISDELAASLEAAGFPSIPGYGVGNYGVDQYGA
jgi:hypothetical protein